MAHNIKELECGRILEKFPEIVSRLKGVLERFVNALSWVDQCFISDDALEQLPTPSQIGKSKVGGIDFNKSRMRWAAEAVLALATYPNGFTATELAAKVRTFSKQSESDYGPRRAAYDLKKLRGKQIVRRVGKTRRYEPVPDGLRALAAVVILRNRVLKPLLAAAQQARPTRGARNPTALDKQYETIRAAMQGVFRELGVAA